MEILNNCTAKKLIAIIPARGGSKGIPGKNIKSFLGKPLIVHSIEAAQAAPQIRSVYVSTDDAEIAQISENSGARIIKRPAEISGDKATTESAVAHCLENLDKQNETPEIIVLLQATSPLRPLNAIESALEKFIAGGYDSLLSISPTHRFFWKIEKDIASAEYDFKNRPRRQDIKPEDIRYIENGSVYIFTKKLFEKTGNRLGGKIGFTIFPDEYSIELDTESDFLLLEKIAQNL